MSFLAAFTALWLLQAAIVATALASCFFIRGRQSPIRFWQDLMRFVHRPRTAHNAR
jgi:hypothetical protein